MMKCANGVNEVTEGLPFFLLAATAALWSGPAQAQTT
jgi:hypothetical protein